MHTSTDRQDFNYGQFAVIRRFKDFVWISHRLEEEFPGIVMPALPVKMLVGKFDQSFVEVCVMPYYTIVWTVVHYRVAAVAAAGQDSGFRVQQ